MRLFLAIFLALAGSASAFDVEEKITHGFLDNDSHPFVGALSGPGNKGQNYAHCSGILVSPFVFLTARHCSWSGKDERTVVSFDGIIENKPEWPGIYYQIKDHGGEKYGMIGGMMHLSPNLDIAVVVLDTRQPWSISVHPILPRLKQFDISHPASFTIVGFGVSQYKQDANVFAKTRQWGISPYKSRTDHSIVTGSNGSSIACWDDSGSPLMAGAGLSESDLVAGILSTADSECSYENRYTRLDSQEAQDFLRPYVSLP